MISGTDQPSIQKKDLIAIRKVTPNDMNFIYSTWMKGMRFGNEYFEWIDIAVYFEKYKKIIDIILRRPNVEVLVACLKQDETVALGYAVFEPKILHWVFVKSAWRKIGIMNDLIPSDFQSVSHLTPPGNHILRRKYKNVIFNPFLN